MLYVVYDVKFVINKFDIRFLMWWLLLIMMVVHTYNNVVLIDDYWKYIAAVAAAVVVDSVLEYMNSNNNNEDDQMMDEFLRKYLLIHDEMVMFHQNLNVVDCVSFEDLNSNYLSLLMMDIDYERLLL